MSLNFLNKLLHRKPDFHEKLAALEEGRYICTHCYKDIDYKLLTPLTMSHCPYCDDLYIVPQKLDEWWVLSPNHINYFSHATLQNLCEGCGFKIVHKTCSFPMELFLLFGDVYIGDAQLGSVCHEKRVKFEKLMRKHGMMSEMDDLYAAFANLNLGRTALIYVTPT